MLMQRLRYRRSIESNPPDHKQVSHPIKTMTVVKPLHAFFGHLVLVGASCARLALASVLCYGPIIICTRSSHALGMQASERASHAVDPAAVALPRSQTPCSRRGA